jgi:hypothetical protein
MGISLVMRPNQPLQVIRTTMTKNSRRTRMVGTVKATTNKSEIKKKVDKIERYLAHHRGDPKICSITVTQTPTTAGLITYLSQIAQGDDGSDRAAYRVNSQYMEFSLSTISTLTNNLRVIIFRDKMNLGATPAVTDVLAAAGVYSPFAYFNNIAQRRFIPLFDRTYSSSAVGTLSHRDKARINDQCTTHFTNTTGAVASAAQNVYFMLVITDVAAASSITTYARSIFTDE